MSADQPWPSQWLRGVLGVCILRVLADGATYGYAIASRLAESRLGVVKGGTLYPLLNRLESAGMVTAEWRAGDGGPGRKYYSLTDEGRRELESTARQWSLFTEVTKGIITGSHDAVQAQTIQEKAIQEKVVQPVPVRKTAEVAS